MKTLLSILFIFFSFQAQSSILPAPYKTNEYMISLKNSFEGFSLGESQIFSSKTCEGTTFHIQAIEHFNSGDVKAFEDFMKKCKKLGRKVPTNKLALAVKKVPTKNQMIEDFFEELNLVFSKKRQTDQPIYNLVQISEKLKRRSLLLYYIGQFVAYWKIHNEGKLFFLLSNFTHDDPTRLMLESSNVQLAKEQKELLGEVIDRFTDYLAAHKGLQPVASFAACLLDLFKTKQVGALCSSVNRQLGDNVVKKQNIPFFVSYILVSDPEPISRSKKLDELEGFITLNRVPKETYWTLAYLESSKPLSEKDQKKLSTYINTLGIYGKILKFQLLQHSNFQYLIGGNELSLFKHQIELYKTLLKNRRYRDYALYHLLKMGEKKDEILWTYLLAN